MGTVSRNFDYSEFEVTYRDELRERNRIPSREVADNVKALVDNVLQPLRDALGCPVVVNSGYRCPDLNAAVGGAANSQHCFDEKTELLTADGWKGYSEIKEGDLIYSYSIGKGVIEVVPIESIIIRHHKGRMMRIKTKQHDICVTDKHRMLVRYGDNTYKRQTGKVLSEKEIAYHESQKTTNNVYHIETADEVFGKRRWYLNAAEYRDGNPSEYPKDFLKLLIATVADGCIFYKLKWFGGIRFTVKKERKIIHITELINSLGYEYTVQKRKYDGATQISVCARFSRDIFNIIGRGKKLPQWFCRLSSDLQRELVFEYAFYDGCFDKRDGSTCFNLTTTSEHNFNILQTMCVLSGMRVTTAFKDAWEYNIKGKKGDAKPVWKMTISTKKKDARVNENQYEWVDYDGIVWCANNRNTTLITRRNNFVSIQGNCEGKAADVHTTGLHSPAAIARAVRRNGIPYDQMIIYNTFVHLSYNNGYGQRMQLLYDKEYRGERL